VLQSVAVCCKLCVAASCSGTNLFILGGSFPFFWGQALELAGNVALEYSLLLVDTPCVLRRVAVCCSVLWRVAMCCSVLQCVAMCCNVLQCVAVCCNELQCVTECSVCCSVLQCVAVCAAVCCSVF